MAAVQILFLAFLAGSALVNTEAAKLGFRNEKIVMEAAKHFEVNQAESRDLRDCFVNHISAVINLAKTTIAAQRVCAEASLPQIIEIENKLLAELIDVHGDLVTLIFNINKCGDRECLKENGAQMLELIGVVSSKVGGAVREGMGIVAQSSPEAAKCVGAAAANFAVEFQNLRQKFVGCIKV